MLLPRGPKLFAHNRRILAERLKWPPEAVRLCEYVEAGRDGWHVSYRHAFGDKPAGYYAFHDNRRWMEDHLYGATAEELAANIRAHRCGRQNEPGF